MKLGLRAMIDSVRLHSPRGLSLQTAGEVAQTVTLALAVLVFTGAKALAQSGGKGGLTGVAETGIFITLPIYVTSLLVVATGSFTLGRWTSNLQRDLLGAINKQASESEKADAENKALRSQLSQLATRLESIESPRDGTD